jgi:flagellar FliL protein
MSMSAASASTAKAAAEGNAPAKGGGRMKLLLIALPLVLALAGAGLWFGGILPPLLGMGGGDAHAADLPAKPADPHAAADPHGAPAPPPIDAKAAAAALARGGANFMELPEVIANLNVGTRRASYVKLRPRLELARPEDEAAIRNAVPRLMDLFQTYLREMRPEELRGSAGTYRLREELIARANIALAPIRIVDVLLPEMLIQ